MIRPIGVADAAAVAALIRTSFAAIAVPLDPPPSALRVTAADVTAALGTGGGVAWDEAGLQACVLWHPRPAGLYIGRLAVHPGRQGRGLARRLIAAAEVEARRRDLPRLLLEVRLALPGNRRLFVSAGFVETALRTHEGYAAPTFAEAEKLLTAPPPGTGTPQGS